MKISKINLVTVLAATALLTGTAGEAFASTPTINESIENNSYQHMNIETYASMNSEERAPKESYQQALTRIKSKLKIKNGFVAPDETASGEQKPIDEIDYSKVPRVASYKKLREIFIKLRDNNTFLSNSNGSPRRISWMYPQEGCDARAAMEGYTATHLGLKRPVKIFAFGDHLSITTPNVPNKIHGEGTVSWLFHVSEILGVIGGKNYVLDPAIDPYEPLLVNTWFDLMGGSAAVHGGVVCNKYTYTYTDLCNSGDESEDTYGVEYEENKYLPDEVTNIINLKYNKNDVLGESPTWNYFLLPNHGDAQSVKISDTTIPITANNTHGPVKLISQIPAFAKVKFNPGSCTQSADKCMFSLAYTYTQKKAVTVILSDGYAYRYITITPLNQVELKNIHR